VPHPTEYETRKKLIDVALKKSGWVVGDRARVVEEVDTKQSAFKAGKYKTRTETLKNPQESAYADYVLLDSLGLPIAVIEGKRTSISYVAGQKQAEDYFNDIKKQTTRPVFIFLTNGHDLWFWNKEFAAPRAVSGYHDRASLERVRFQNEEGARPLAQLPVDEKIINRDYQIESVKRVLEGIDKGHHKPC
jgi:type I restriction enzyme R subunit